MGSTAWSLFRWGDSISLARIIMMPLQKNVDGSIHMQSIVSFLTMAYSDRPPALARSEQTGTVPGIGNRYPK